MEHLQRTTKNFLKVVRADPEMDNWVNSGWWPPKGSDYMIPYFWWDGPVQFGCAPTRPAVELLIHYAMELDPEVTGYNIYRYTVAKSEVKDWLTANYDGLRFTPFHFLEPSDSPEESVKTQAVLWDVEEVLDFIEKEQSRNLLK